MRQTDIKFTKKPQICVYSKFSSMNFSMKNLKFSNTFSPKISIWRKFYVIQFTLFYPFILYAEKNHFKIQKVTQKLLLIYKITKAQTAMFTAFFLLTLRGFVGFAACQLYNTLKWILASGICFYYEFKINRDIV
jgi:hypothetical protein